MKSASVPYRHSAAEGTMTQQLLPPAPLRWTSAVCTLIIKSSASTSPRRSSKSLISVGSKQVIGLGSKASKSFTSDFTSPYCRLTKLTPSTSKIGRQSSSGTERLVACVRLVPPFQEIPTLTSRPKLENRSFHFVTVSAFGQR